MSHLPTVHWKKREYPSCVRDSNIVILASFQKFEKIIDGIIRFGYEYFVSPIKCPHVMSWSPEGWSES